MNLEKFKILVLMSVLVLGFQNCKFKGTETGDPSVRGSRVRLSGYAKPLAGDLSLPNVDHSVSDVRMCIFKIRFKTDEQEDQLGKEVEIEMGLVQLKPEGTDLGELGIEPGIYRHADIVLDQNCGEEFSLSILNEFGNFSIYQPETLKFAGEIEVHSSGGDVVLDIVPFIEHFNTIESESQLASGFDGLVGRFDDSFYDNWPGGGRGNLLPTNPFCEDKNLQGFECPN